MSRANTLMIRARVAGIPCQAVVAIYPGSPAVYGEGGITEEPDDPGEVEVLELLDRRGRRARWLEAKNIEPELFWPDSWDDDL